MLYHCATRLQNTTKALGNVAVLSAHSLVESAHQEQSVFVRRRARYFTGLKKDRAIGSMPGDAGITEGDKFEQYFLFGVWVGVDDFGGVGFGEGLVHVKTAIITITS